MKTRAILVGDHAFTLTDMHYLLSTYGDLRIAARAQSADGLLVQLEAYPYDLLVTDLMMPGSWQADGLRLVQGVRRCYPDPPTIVVTILDNPALVSSLPKLGIHSLVGKRGMFDDLPRAIRHTGCRLFISGSIAHLLEMGEVKHSKPLASPEQLTPREVEMLCLYGSDPTVGEITTRLCRSKQTVSTQKSSAMHKLGLDSNAGLFIYIRGSGLARAARPRYVRPVSPLRKTRAVARMSRNAGCHPCPPSPKDSSRMDRSRRLSAQLCLLPLGLASQTETREPQPCVSRLLSVIARQVGHDGRVAPSYEPSGPFSAVACKPWPDSPAQTVVAMAYLDPDDTAVEDERHPHLLLAKADSRSGRLFERYDSDLEEDASVVVGSDSSWLGTARYRLSPTVRTFGAVFHSVACGTGYPETGFDNLLTLAVSAGDGKLRSVLNTYLDQWRTLRGPVCSAEPGFEQGASHLTLELGRGRSNGFTSLVVTSRVSDNEAESGKPLRTVKRALRHDGERHPLEEYSGFWHRR